MKLKCPACGAPIPAAGINVQQMVAICPECDNVFKFDTAFTQERRKIKAPAQFRIVDDDSDRLDMAFKWSWRTEPPFSLIAIVFALSLLLITLFGMFGMLSEGVPLLALLIPLVPVAFLGYTLLTIAVNSTHYESDGETLRVHTTPLPFFRYGKKTFAVEEIDRVTVERPAYALFPEGKAGFYDVYVHTLDGDKVRIAAIVNYEHAHFIAQEVEAHVRALKEAPALTDSALTVDDEPDAADQEALEAMPRESSRKAFPS